MKYFIELSYHGGRYHGWQRQKNVPTVQHVLEGQLSKLFKEKINVIGCGRTDAGVHASQYFAHIKTDKSPGEAFVFRMNKSLPPDIAISRIFPVDAKAHAQHNAVSRTYTYHFHSDKNPLINQTSVEIPLYKLNIPIVKKGLELISRHRDFHIMCKNPNAYKTTLCDIYETAVLHPTDNQLAIRICANRFLRHMVRLMMSKIIAIGLGNMALDSLAYHFEHNIPFKYFDPLPPQGLWLTRITYPNSIMSNRKNNIGSSKTYP